jgi:hypothetical protein
MTQPTNRPTVTLPVFGTVQRRWVYVAAASVAVLVGYAYWSRARGGAASSSGGGAGYDPALGSVSYPSSYVNPVPDAPPSGEVVVDQAVIRSDAQWSLVAIDRLSAADVNPLFAATTIGKYLAGMELSAQEADTVRAAWALAGYPPSGVPLKLATIAPPPSQTPPPTQTTAPSSNPGYNTDTHTQARAGSSVSEFLSYYYGGSHALWQSLNQDTPTTANTSGGKFVKDMTYRLPGYTLGGNKLPY